MAFFDAFMIRCTSGSMELHLLFSWRSYMIALICLMTLLDDSPLSETDEKDVLFSVALNECVYEVNLIYQHVSIEP